MHTRSTLSPLAVLAMAAALLAPACGGPKDVDDVPLGSDVSVVTTDGSKVDGKLVGVTDQDVVVQRENTGKRDTIERASIATVEEKTGATIADLVKPEPKTHDVTVPAGTIVPATLDVALGSDTNRAEDSVTATVRTPVTVDGFEAIPAGATLHGNVLSAEPAGKVKGRASIAFSFDQLTIDHKDYDVSTNHVSYRANATKKEDAAKIGAGAGIGSAIGAIAGGGKGAAIGAAIGGGAGTAVVMTTAGEEIHLAPGAELHLELQGPVTISVPND
jgi:hypothetical protein